MKCNLKLLSLTTVVWCICLAAPSSKSEPIQPKQPQQLADVRTNGRPDSNPNRAILPADFKVYTRGTAVVNTPYPGFQQKILPTVNRFTGDPGCYIACYSRQQDNSIYPVGGGMYVMGQVRVPGSYESRICRPKGYEQADISAEPKFKQLCHVSLPNTCNGDSCWAGGDTGGWFGIP